MIWRVLDWLHVPAAWVNAYDDWTERMYYRSCGGPRIWWRFWFEVTGQGRSARRYMRVMRHGRKQRGRR